MMISAAKAAKAAGGRILCGSGDITIENISTDSKHMKGHDLFVPIKGARVDSHKFIIDAAENGAVAAFSAYDLSELAHLAGMSEEEYIDRLNEASKAAGADSCKAEHEEAGMYNKAANDETDSYRNAAEGAYNSSSVLAHEDSIKSDAAAHGNFEGFTIIKLDNAGDGLQALQELAACYRREYVRIPYIGITGSVGKTTTREMTACALQASYKVYSTKGNANSQTGTPITVTETDEDAEIGVIEMGMSEPGEMSRLSKVVQCDTAVFTVIGVSHIGNLGSRENIMREKLHILDCISDNGTLILNGDDDMLSRSDIHDFFPEGTDAKHIRVIYYGTGDNAFVRAADISEMNGRFSYTLYVGGTAVTKVTLSVPGEHMLLNSLAALAAAYAHDADMVKAAVNVGAFESLDGRGRIYESRGIRIINDAYNAAPQSVRAGLKVLNSMQDNTERRVAVLADMLELGPDEDRFHREVGEFIAAEAPDIDIVMLYGELSKYTAEGIKLGFCEDPSRHMPWIYCFDSIEELETALKQEIYPGDAILFKGSNSMKLGPLVNKLYPENTEQA